MSKPRTMIISVAAVAVAAIAGVASAAPNGGEPAAPVAAAAPTPLFETVAVAAVPESVVSHFALFREQPAAPMPADLVKAIASPTKYGRNARLARSFPTPSGKGWVIPGNGYLCIAIPDPVDGYGESCTTIDVVLQQGLWVRLSGDVPDAPAIDALLSPDGSASAAAHMSATVAPGLTVRQGVTGDALPSITG